MKKKRKKRGLIEYLQLASHSLKSFICINSHYLHNYQNLHPFKKKTYTHLPVLYLYFLILHFIFYKINNVPQRNCGKIFKGNYKSSIIYSLEIITIKLLFIFYVEILVFNVIGLT